MRGEDASARAKVRAAAQQPNGDAGRDDPERLPSHVSGDGRRAVRPGLARMEGIVRAPGLQKPHSPSLPGGGQHPSGTRGADGGTIRPHGCGGGARGPCFAQDVVPGGYAWWYVDALSADGTQGISLIAFVGSVFSPYYALARRRGPADPEAHCALNVAIYAPNARRWAMTERGKSAISRDARCFAIGPSALEWDGRALTVHIDEVAVPIPRRLSGSVRVTPSTLQTAVFELDAAGRHRWQPIAPQAHVEVAFTRPALRWSGSGYLDCNAGDAPLDDGFSRWTWSRAQLGEQTAVLYDVTERSGLPRSLSICIGRDGQVEPFEAPAVRDLARTWWGLPRATRADRGAGASVIRTFEDTPFYARSSIATRLLNAPTVAMHEFLSLDRFRRLPVQMMLPFRMPRRAG
jgi:carotenoid 1,2-hydratase